MNALALLTHGYIVQDTPANIKPRPPVPGGAIVNPRPTAPAGTALITKPR